MRSSIYPMAGLALLLPIAVNATNESDQGHIGLGDYPSEKTCQADREASYALGYAAGRTDGWNLGHQAGHDYGIRSCVAEPLQFGVTLASVIPAAQYGETEPNDNFISADPLVQGMNFWGQLYSVADRDWFYTETTAPNQNILVTFSVPYWINDVNLREGRPAVWNISVRDAAGNIFANYNTNVMGAIDSYDKDRETYYSMTYSVTAGLAGTYYVVVSPADETSSQVPDKNAPTYYPYSVAVVVQDSPLPGQQPVVGFYDSEVEPNDVPSRANPLASGVTMYGLINLTFNEVLPSSTSTWVQGEDDWFVYRSNGNEIATLSFCLRESCGPGDWFVEVYDHATAARLEAGEPRQNLRPLLAINTNNTDKPRTISINNTDKPQTTFRVGLRDPGYYFMRVNHKRLFTAPCLKYQFVSRTSKTGFADDECECDSGNDCFAPIKIELVEKCKRDLICKKVKSDCIPGVDDGCEKLNEPPGLIVQNQARCSCSQYGDVVQVPENEYTSPYNFTWHGSQLPPSTIDTDAYEDFLDRPNPYTP